MYNNFSTFFSHWTGSKESHTSAVQARGFFVGFFVWVFFWGGEIVACIKQRVVLGEESAVHVQTFRCIQSKSFDLSKCPFIKNTEIFHCLHFLTTPFVLQVRIFCSCLHKILMASCYRFSSCNQYNVLVRFPVLAGNKSTTGHKTWLVGSILSERFSKHVVSNNTSEVMFIKVQPVLFSSYWW